MARNLVRRAENACLLVGSAAVAVFVVAVLPGVRAAGSESLLLDFGAYYLGIVLSVCVVALRAVQQPQDRLCWLLLGLGPLAYLAGDTLWTLYVQDLRPQPYPSPADAAYLLVYPVSYAGLVLLARRRARRLPMAVWLDGLVIGLGLASLASAYVLAPVLQATGGRFPVVATNLAYPLGDLLLMVVVATAIGVFGLRASRSWWLLLSGFGLLAVTDGVYLLQLSNGSYVTSTLLDAGWPVAFLLVALAARASRTDMATTFERPTTFAVVPLLSAAAALVVLISGQGQNEWPWAVTLLAGATVTLALLRLAVTIRQTQALAQSRMQARTDELTGLPNRRAFYERAEEFTTTVDDETPEAPSGGRALLLLDLDRFKEINDSLGHVMGDELLRQVGPRLAAQLREGDVIARLGGDEFGVLLFGTDVEDAPAVAERLCGALREPFTLGDVNVHVAASLGFARSPEHGTDVTQLLQRADVAMYSAKRQRIGWSVYLAEEDPNSPQRLRLVEQLRHAIHHAPYQFELHYQPKVRLADGRVSGVEALVRWEHPDEGLLYPGAFLSLVEEHGLMHELTHRVLDEALTQCARWRAQGLDLPVAVNLSSTMVVDLDLPYTIRGRLQGLGLPAEALEVEITEDFLMSDWVRARAVLTAIRAIGVRVSVDDFGTGYSSLAYLRDLPIDQLKLDRSFIMPMADDPMAAALVQSTVSLAHSLGLDMVAEGVESEAVLRRLGEFGCDQAQGFHLGRPMPAAALERWMRLAGRYVTVGERQPA